MAATEQSRSEKKNTKSGHHPQMPYTVWLKAPDSFCHDSSMIIQSTLSKTDTVGTDPQLSAYRGVRLR